VAEQRAKEAEQRAKEAGSSMAGNEGWRPEPLHILAAALGHPHDSKLAVDITSQLRNLIVKEGDRGMICIQPGTNVLELLNIEDPCPDCAKVCCLNWERDGGG
jgi:hypothetical protein